MKAPRIAARIAGNFILRVLVVFLIVLALIGVSVAIEVWITTSQEIPNEIAHYFQIAALIFSLAAIGWASWLFGRMLSGPLATVIAWTDNLARDELEPPRTADGQVIGKDAHGDWRAGYRTFHEVFDALEVLTDKLRESERQRAELRKMREDWVAGVSHDLKTPLAAVRGYAQLLATDEEPPEEVHRQAAAILNHAQHMEQLIDDLRLTTSLRAKALPLDFGRLDVVALTSGALLAVEQDPVAEAYRFEFDGPSDPIWVCADSNLLGRAVRNLIINAVAHNPAGTNIRASVAVVDRVVRIAVADDGVGMDDETVSRLFDRYYRGTATNVDAGGTGLGMAIAAQLVEAHRGTIDVESDVGVGTTVTICMPEYDEGRDDMACAPTEPS